MEIEHRLVIYRGRVQGVGFRATTLRLARGFAVDGHVRNLEDGSVEVRASGTPGELDRFLDAIERRHAGRIARRTSSPILPADGEPSGFSIRY